MASNGAKEEKGRYEHMGRLGWEELKAYFRQGLAEVRAAFYGDSRIAQPPDPAMYGVISHGEAADVRRSTELQPERESVLAAFEKSRDPNRDEGPAPQQNRDNDNRGREGPEPERE